MTRKEFYDSHTICPNCKSGNLFVSNIVVVTSVGKGFVDKLNSARCTDCGWRGRVIELLDKSKVTANE